MRRILNAQCMGTTTEAHRHIKEMLEFPDYYGENLDALYDCLSDYDGLEIAISNCRERDEHLDKICRVMQDAGVQVRKI